MKIRILRVITIVCALLEAPFVHGSRGNVEVEIIIDPSRPHRPSSLNGGGIKGVANVDTLRSSSNPEKQLPRPEAIAHLRGARSIMGWAAEDDRQLQVDNIFRTNFGCDAFCNKPRNNCGNKCNGQIASCEARGIACHPWLCTAFCRGNRSSTYCQDRRISTSECNRYRKRCGCTDYRTTGRYKPVTGLAAIYDSLADEVVITWDKVKGPKRYDVLVSQDGQKLKKVSARGRKKGLAASSTFEPGQSYEVAVRRKKTKTMDSSPYTMIQYEHTPPVDPAQQHRAYNDLVSTTEDYTSDLTGNVLLNDFDPDFGHTLTVDVARVSGPPGSMKLLSGDGGSVIITLTNGSTLSLRSDGSYAFRRAPGSYQEFSGAQTDFETFTYAFNDGHGNSAEADLVIGIQGVNDAPVAVSDLFYHRSPGGSASLGDVAEGCVLENDADVDHGDEASLAVCVIGGSELRRSSYHQVVDLGENIKLSIAVDGCFSMFGLSSKYAKLQNGTTADECFFYRACDGHHDDSSNYMSNVAEACVRVEGAFVDACVPNPCEHGTCSASSTNAGTYTCSCESGWEVPEGGAICSQDINECVVTPNGGCDPLTNCTNSAGGYTCGPCPPGYSGTGETKCIDESQMHKAQDDTEPTNEDYVGDLTGNVIDNDFDPDFGHTLKVDLRQVVGPAGSTVTYSGDGLSMMIKLPNGSTLSLSTNGIYTFRRASGAYQELSGTQDAYEEFKYVVDDNHGNTAEANLYVRIQGANDAPIALNDVFVHSGSDPTAIEDVADGCVLENDKDIDIGDVGSLAVCVVDGVEIQNDVHQHVDLGQHTKLSIGTDGCFTISGLATEYQYLTKGEIADVCFFYQACDGFSYKSNVAEACVRVEGEYDAGDPVGDPLGDQHEINGGRAFDEDGNFLANIFQGDMLVTFSQVADMFGLQFAYELKKRSGGFIFPPEESGFNQESRAMSITHRPRNRWPEDNRGFANRDVPLKFKHRGYAGKILVPYDFSSNIDLQKQRIIIKAMRELERSEVLRFIDALDFDELVDSEGEESTIRNHFIRFIRQDDVPNENPDKPPRLNCGWSYVGFLEEKMCRCRVRPGCTCQTISLGYSSDLPPKSCGYSLGTIQHEILHALGFLHEHSRSDRNAYIKVNYENIIAGEDNHNFDLEAASVSLGTIYDYGSIMHYHRKAFCTAAAKASDLNSIDIIRDTEPFQANPDLLGQHIALSNTDLLQLRLVYLCSTGAKDVGDFAKCSIECPCWENAPYRCENSDECQAGLTCVLRPYELRGRQEPYCTDLPVNTKGCEINPPSQPGKICVDIETGECLYSDPNTYRECYGHNPEKPICSTSNRCIPCFEWSNDSSENDSRCYAIVGNRQCNAETGACTGDVSCSNDSDCSPDSTCSNGICIKSGNPRFSLYWAGEEANDLDLYVITPGGFELSYMDDYDPITKGRLDKDFIPFDEEHDGKDGPWIENIYFPVGEAPDGSYEVFVHNEGVYDDTAPLDPFTFEIWEDPNDSPLFSYSGEGLAEDSDSPHFVYTKPDSLVVGITLPCNPNPCDHGTCSESSTAAGGYSCSCDSGWKGTNCDEDIDECSANSGGCDPLTNCTNTNGGYSCSACPSGYSGDGKTGCKEIPKPCVSNPCGDHGACSESSSVASGYTCSCDSGWEGTHCDENINECATNNGGCDPIAICTDTDGGRTCTCPAGYSSDGEAGCVDIDECATNNGGCDPLTTCTNTDGGIACSACPSGYSGNGESGCVDIDECATNNGGCDPLTTCTNTKGGYSCSACPSGYSGNGESGCVDIDECATNNGGCDPLTTCTNTKGGYSCSACPSGYSGNGESGCVDIDECATNNGGCDPLTTCTNTDGGIACSACPSGYSGNGESGCVDIDECDDGNNGGCDPLTTCANTNGGYSCSACPSGYSGDGKSGCVDINECETNQHKCHEHATCVNLFGAYMCSCDVGYYGNGSFCQVILKFEKVWWDGGNGAVGVDIWNLSQDPLPSDLSIPLYWSRGDRIDDVIGDPFGSILVPAGTPAGWKGGSHFRVTTLAPDDTTHMLAAFESEVMALPDVVLQGDVNVDLNLVTPLMTSIIKGGLRAAGTPKVTAISASLGPELCVVDLGTDNLLDNSRFLDFVGPLIRLYPGGKVVDEKDENSLYRLEINVGPVSPYSENCFRYRYEVTTKSTSDSNIAWRVFLSEDEETLFETLAFVPADQYVDVNNLPIGTMGPNLNQRICLRAFKGLGTEFGTTSNFENVVSVLEVKEKIEPTGFTVFSRDLAVSLTLKNNDNGGITSNIQDTECFEPSDHHHGNRFCFGENFIEIKEVGSQNTHWPSYSQAVFTTLPGENEIYLVAEASTSITDDRIAWDIREPNEGFTITSAVQLGRLSAFIADHKPISALTTPRYSKPIEYEITAFEFESQNGAIIRTGLQSPPVRIIQDSKSQIRQEYVDKRNFDSSFNVPTPDRASLISASEFATNSPYFTFREIARHSDFYDDTTDTGLAIIDDSAKIANKLRAEWGHPIIVTSGWRNPRRNDAVGGALNSKHQNGNAIDLNPQIGSFPATFTSYKKAQEGLTALAKSIFDVSDYWVDFHNEHLHIQRNTPTTSATAPSAPLDLTRWETALMSCTVTGKNVGGIAGSESEARTGYEKMMSVNPGLLDVFRHVGNEVGIPVAVVLGLASRESNFGDLLNEEGYSIYTGNDGFGVLQVDPESGLATEGGPFSEAHVRQALLFFKDLLERLDCKCTECHCDGCCESTASVPEWISGCPWEDCFKLRGAMVAYNIWIDDVCTKANLDGGTANDDYSSDVIARAQWFQREGKV